MADRDSARARVRLAHEAGQPEAAFDGVAAGLGFEFRPGEDIAVPATGAAHEAALRFREVLGRFATGVTIVTAVHEGEPVGLTCQSFTSVSLDPPLVLFVPARTSRAWPRIERAGAFCVNVLARGQQELAEVFASRGTDKFAGVEWRPGVTGAPVLAGGVAWVDCVLHAVHGGGDHLVVLGRVRDLGAPGDADPLLFLESRYRGADRGPEGSVSPAP